MNYKVIKDYGDNIAIVANADNMVNIWLKDSNKLVSPTLWFDNVRREKANVYKIAYHNANNYDRFDFVFLHNDHVSLLSYNAWFSLVEDLIHEQVHIWKTNIKYRI